jgi:hypothetical protein
MSESIKPPTQRKIAEALSLSDRRVRALIGQGMPSHSIEAAIQWRASQLNSDSADELRRARIALVKSQREKIEVENARLRRELISLSEVCQDIFVCFSLAKSEFVKLQSELPPRLEGLEAPAMQRILRDEIYAVLERLSNATEEMFEVHASPKPELA